MSDDEASYEYEYDDDAMEEENFEYTDEEEEANDAEVALENTYYNAKGSREEDLKEAAEAFEQVIVQEAKELADKDSTAKYGQWSFKSMKQLVKLHLRTGNAEEIMRHYQRLLDCVSTGDIAPNAVEKGINGMLDRVATLLQGSSHSRFMDAQAESGQAMDPQKLALAVYDATLKVFHPSVGACPSERLWFKTNLKYGQLLYEMHETAKLQQVLRDLKMTQSGPEDEKASSGYGTSTHAMEIYALQIQLYSRQKDNKKLREVFNTAMQVRGGIPHPRTVALIQELGGKMHMAAKEYEEAGKTFFQAFKSYDEAGDPSRLRCLKYLVLASMLHASSINPFDSQEARPYRDDPEITAMTSLVQAFHNNDIQQFEKILRQSRGRIMEDEFVREHIEDLLRTIRTQVLRRVIRPYTRISLTAISRELNDIPVEDVQCLLVNLILDGSLDGSIDQVAGVLLKEAERGTGNSGSKSHQESKEGSSEESHDAMIQKHAALNQLAKALEDISTSISFSKMKETMPMRGSVH